MQYVNYVIVFLSVLLVGGCTGPRSSTELRSSTVANHQGADVALNALALLNSPYRYGGAHPSTGFDCSGLVFYVFQPQTATPIPRQSGEQARLGRAIALNQLEAGDLVFFNTLGKANSHVGIYIGDGNFINAPSSGGHVRIDSLHNPYFKQRFTAARRFFEL